HRDHVARNAGDAHLRQAYHTAVAGKHGERQRDRAEDQRIATDLEGKERRGDQRVDDQPCRGCDGQRIEPERWRGGGGAGRLNTEAAFNSAHAARPMIPCGRKASTATMMMKVSTMP